MYCIHTDTCTQNFKIFRSDAHRFTNILIWHKSQICMWRSLFFFFPFFFSNSRHHCRSWTMFMFTSCLVAWSFCHLGDVDLGVTAAEIDTPCLGVGSGWKKDYVDLPCPEHFSQPSMAFLFAWRWGTCSFCFLGLVVWTIFACCRVLLDLHMTFNGQFTIRQFCSSQWVSELKGLGDERPTELEISLKYLPYVV